MSDLDRWLNQEIGIPHHGLDDEEAASMQPEVRREWRFDEDDATTDDDQDD